MRHESKHSSSHRRSSSYHERTTRRQRSSQRSLSRERKGTTVNSSYNHSRHKSPAAPLALDRRYESGRSNGSQRQLSALDERRNDKNPFSDRKTDAARFEPASATSHYGSRNSYATATTERWNEPRQKSPEMRHRPSNPFLKDPVYPINLSDDAPPRRKRGTSGGRRKRRSSARAPKSSRGGSYANSRNVEYSARRVSPKPLADERRGADKYRYEERSNERALPANPRNPFRTEPLSSNEKPLLRRSHSLQRERRDRRVTPIRSALKRPHEHSTKAAYNDSAPSTRYHDERRYSEREVDVRAAKLRRSLSPLPVAALRRRPNSREPQHRHAIEPRHEERRPVLREPLPRETERSAHTEYLAPSATRRYDEKERKRADAYETNSAATAVPHRRPYEEPRYRPDSKEASPTVKAEKHRRPASVHKKASSSGSVDESDKSDRGRPEKRHHKRKVVFNQSGRPNLDQESMERLKEDILKIERNRQKGESVRKEKIYGDRRFQIYVTAKGEVNLIERKMRRSETLE